MTQWIMQRWHGAPEAVGVALRGLGWFGPGEEPLALPDQRIGGFLPLPGEPMRVLDGVAYAALAVSAPVGCPDGIAETGPDLSAALIGSF